MGIFQSASEMDHRMTTEQFYVFDPWEFGDAYKKTHCIMGIFQSASEMDHRMTTEQFPKSDALLMPEIKKLKSVNNKQTRLFHRTIKRRSCLPSIQTYKNLN